MPESVNVSRRALMGGTAAVATGFAFQGLAQAQNKSGHMVVGVNASLLTLDPADANDTLSQSAARLMLEGLLGFDKDMKVIPLLAESWQANDAATEFTFHLRKGVTFQDGTPFDATAVKINLERIANPANRLKRQGLLSMLDHVEAVDPHTAKVVLKTPFGAFLPTVAHPALQLLSPAAIKKFGKDIGRNPVGTGPFRFASWTPDTLKVERNPHYWQKGMPHLDAVTVRSNPEDGARIAMLQAGEAQFVYPVPAPMLNLVKKNPKLRLVDRPSVYVSYAAMNVNRKPFDDPRVRRALNYAVDKEAFVRVVLNGAAQPLNSAEPPKITFYSAQTPYAYDTKKARQLLAAAGLKNGFETTLWAANDSLTISAMQFLQQQLGMVGVKLNVEPLEEGVLVSRIFATKSATDSRLAMYYGHWSSSTGDADWALRPLFATESAPPHLYNVGYYSNKSVDKDLHDALKTADPKVRGKLYADAQARIWKDAPWIFLAVPNNLAGVADTLHDAWLLPDDGMLIDAAKFG